MPNPSKILIEPEICPRCGSRFTCGKSGKCWCFSVDVPREVLEMIEKKYDTCLCPNCLKELAASIDSISKCNF